MLATDVPKTDAQLFEFLRSKFGWGYYIEGGVETYAKYRIREVSKIKGMRQRRNIKIEDVVMVAEYCRAHRKSPPNLTALMRYYNDARSWRARITSEEAQAEAQREIDNAIAYELTLPDSPWLDILVRATGTERVGVLEKWKHARHR